MAIVWFSIAFLNQDRETRSIRVSSSTGEAYIFGKVVPLFQCREIPAPRCDLRRLPGPQQLLAPRQIESNTPAAGNIRSFMNQAILKETDDKATVITIPGFIQLHCRGCEFVSGDAEDYADSVRPVPAFEKEVPP